MQHHRGEAWPEFDFCRQYRVFLIKNKISFFFLNNLISSRSKQIFKGYYDLLSDGQVVTCFYQCFTETMCRDSDCVLIVFDTKDYLKYKEIVIFVYWRPNWMVWPCHCDRWATCCVYTTIHLMLATTMPAHKTNGSNFDSFKGTEG